LVDSVIDRDHEIHRLKEESMGAPDISDDPRKRLGRLVAEYFDSVFRAVKRFGAPASSAGDGAQQVFLIAATKLDSIQGASERAFLLGTAFRVAKELRRKSADLCKTASSESAALSQPDSAPDLDEVVDQKRARLVLDELLTEMDDTLRAVFVLYEIEELTIPEIAEALELAPGTAASRLRRAREAFEQSIARHRARERFSVAPAHDAFPRGSAQGALGWARPCRPHAVRPLRDDVSKR